MKGDTSSEYKTCRLNMNFNRKIVGGGTVDTKQVEKIPSWEEVVGAIAIFGLLILDENSS